MKYFLSLLCALIWFPLTTNAQQIEGDKTKVRSGIDYSNCNPRPTNTLEGGSSSAAYAINKDGNLGFDLKSDRVVKWNAAENKLSYRDFWYNNQPGPVTTITLKKMNNRPSSIEAVYDTSKSNDNAYYSMPASTKVSFAYNGNRCFVNEISMKDKDGKESVNYSQAFCKQILDLTKKATMKKLVECKSTFANIQATIGKYMEKFSGEGKNFNPGGYSYYNNQASMGESVLDQDWNAFSAIGNCNSIRAIYGNPIDPATQGDAYGIGGGFGSGGSSGMGGVSFPEETTPAK